MKRMTLSAKVTNIACTTVVALVALLMVLPFLNIIAISLSDPESIMVGKVSLFPVGFNAEAYMTVFRDASMRWSMAFTVILTLVYTAAAMIMTICLAYPLSKKRLVGQKFFMTLVVFTMYFTGGIIPDYLLMKNLHITNTMWVLILPGLISAYNMIILKSFMLSIPESLEESVRIDGGSDFCYLFRFVLPLSKPVLATLCLFYAVFRWNAFQDALYYITDTKLYPLQLKLNLLINIAQASDLTQFEGANLDKLLPENLKSASIMFATVPILLVYPWLQRYFVTGITLGAVKG